MLCLLQAAPWFLAQRRQQMGKDEYHVNSRFF